MFDTLDFQNPSALWGLTLVFAPLLIFLFLKRSPQVIPWGAMRFLRHAQNQVRPRSRFREIFRLFCQTVGILSLILAVATPFWSTNSEIEQIEKTSLTSSETAFLIVVDTSASMQETTRSETAQQLVSVQRGAWLSQTKASENAEIHVITTGDSTVADWSTTLEKIREIIDSNKKPNWREIVVVSDFTDTPETLHNFLTDVKTLAPEATCRAMSVFEAVPNVALVALEPPHTPILSEQKTSVTATLQNDSDTPVIGVCVDFSLQKWVQEKEIASSHYETVKTGQKWVDIPAHDKKSVTWETEIQESGEHIFVAELSVSETAQDTFLMDNSLHFGFNAQKEARFLMVETWGENLEPENTGNFRKTAGTHYLRAALEGIFSGRYPETTRTILKMETLTEADLATYDLSTFHAVFLCEPTIFTPKEAEVLQNYVENGGALWLFPGNRTTPETLAPISAILPAELLKNEEQDKTETVLTPVLPPEEEDLTEIFRQNPDSGLETAPISHAFSLRVYPESTTVLQLNDGRPLLVLRKITGKSETQNGGRTVISAISADTAGSTLPLLPVWLPLVDKTIHFLTSISKFPVENGEKNEISTILDAIHIQSESASLNRPCASVEIPTEWKFRHVQLTDLKPQHTVPRQPLISVLFLITAVTFFVAGVCLPRSTSK